MLVRTLLAAAAIVAGPVLDGAAQAPPAATAAEHSPAAGASPAQPGGSTPRALTVAAPAGDFAAGLRDVYIDAFAAATGMRAHYETSAIGLETLRARGKDWDVVLLTADDLAVACDDGLLERLDWSAIGGRDHYLPIGQSDCGVGGMVQALVLAWDRDKFQGTPNWSDFFDIAKTPGKRGLRGTARGALEIALLADGVAPGDIYRTLRTGDGVDRAFRKLDQLRPYIAWWQTDEEAARMLASGEVLMAAAPNGRVTGTNRADGRNFGLQWNGGLLSVMWWALPKGASNTKAGTQYLYFVGAPAIEARLLAHAPYAGTAKGVNDFTPPDLLPISPLAPANLSAALLVDEQFWRDSQERLNGRFASWLAH